jgi:hypothetical protein
VKRLNVLAIMATAVLPLSTNATTMTVPVTWPSPTVIPTGSNNFSNPFTEFNPVLGTLTSYSLTIAGSGTTSTNDLLPFDIAFEAPVSFDTILQLAGGLGVGPFTFAGNGNTNSTADLAGITGTGQASFLLQNLLMEDDNSVSLTFTS